MQEMKRILYETISKINERTAPPARPVATASNTIPVPATHTPNSIIFSD